MKKIIICLIALINMSLSCAHIVSVVVDEVADISTNDGAGRKFNIGDLVQVSNPESSFFGSIAKVINDDPDRVEQYRHSNGCSGDCVIYSLITLHDQQQFECCQSYLVPAQIR
ncbi:MAG: hypothetical protein P4L31_04490 [Candidatus Babeliales bacterium]|nr:hypothetical protein [Candidatus Babeliales bacterium]